MRKVLWWAAAAAAAVVVVLPGTSSAAVSCTSVLTSKGSLTAARVGGDVTGTLDATGCDIGVYYDASNTGAVDGATISGATRYGVFVDGEAGNVRVNVTSSTIDDIGDTPLSGGQYGLGVYYAGYTGGATGTVRGNTVSAYQKGGIVVDGEHADVNVTGNSISGVGATLKIAQNGIQFGFGGGGQARDNTVAGNWYTGATWASTGILVFESSNVVVDGNTVSNNQVGLDAESWCWVGIPSANNNKFVGNTVTGSDYGVSVAAYSVGGYSECDPAADNNKVTNNDLSGTSNSGSEGVFVGAYAFTPSFTPEAVNNKVIHNTISGFETPIDASLASATKVHANPVQ